MLGHLPPDPDSTPTPSVAAHTKSIDIPPETKKLVHTVAMFVVEMGPDMEKRIMANNNDNNDKFNFLIPSHPHHAYYQHQLSDRLEEVLNKNPKSYFRYQLKKMAQTNKKKEEHPKQLLWGTKFGPPGTDTFTFSPPSRPHFTPRPRQMMHQPLPDEPEPKRHRVDASTRLIPEDHFLAQHPGPGRIVVSVPNADEGNLKGQLLVILIGSLSETIGSLKEKIAGEVELPLNKFKLTWRAAFLMDNMSLAQYNIGAGETVALVVAE